MEIKEWLNEDNTLGIDIWEQKYRYNNETFDEFLDRVSAGDPDLRQLIVDKKFLFGGRILANRGIEAKGKTYSNCFLAGTRVLTKDGYKNIEEIQCGELVYTHTGKWNKVNKLLVRKYVGSIYKIQSNNLLSPIFCTPNHKFLTSSGEWKAIENFVIQSGKTTKIDRLVSPNEMIYHEWTDLNIDITSDFVCPVNRRLYYKDNAAGIEEFINDRGSYIWRKPRNLITRNFVLDEEMLYLIGRWIGDGSVTIRKEKTNPSIWQIVFNAQNEKEAFDICYKILKSHFPTINITTRETNQNVLALRVENELFATWFKNNFGQGCSGKYIPKWIGYPRNLLLGLLDADGSVHSQGDFKLLLKNPELIRWARQALFNLGICTTLIKSETRQVADYFTIIKNQNRKLIPYLNKKYSDNRMLVNLNLDCSSVKIDSIEILENYDTLVYNLSVENDHSYLVNGVFVHNCYVLPSIEDSIESIYETCGMLARTFSYGGGCGVDISKLRPSGAKVNNSAKTTTGAVSFMQTLSMVAETIGQRSRRGATMISISVNHPDVEEFINCKTDLNKVTGANISVRVTDEFMKAVENDEDYTLRWPCTENQNVQLEEYNKLYETPFGYAKKVKAKELFNKLVYNNWDYAEPGILYWDRISKWNIVSEDPNFEYAGTNPCAEEPLPEGGSCLLGSINLAAFVNGKTFDYDEYKRTIRIAVRALNKVLADGMPLHPLKIQQESVANWRQIGLGVMGIADMLIKMGIKYDSEAGLVMCKSISNMLASEALDESANLAQSMEGAYPKFNLDAVLASDYVKKHAYPETIDKIKKYGLYNSQLLTIAPTGTLSTMLQISGGIEPIFAMSYTRTTKSLHGEDKDYKVYTKIAQDWLDANPNSELPEYFVESGTIDSNFRIKMQGVWQESIDASISSTVNLPETATVEDVYNIYMGAWKEGLKGITIFRANCKRVAILNVASKEDDTKEENPTELKRGEIIRAGDDCIGLKRTLMTGCGTLHCTAYFDPSNGDLRETYLSKGSQGGCNNFMIGLSRMISLAARGGIKLESIVDQLKSSGTCPSYAVRRATKHDTSIGSSCPVAVGNALVDMHKEILERIESCTHEYIKPITIESIKIDNEKYSECPECHNKSLIHDGGCVQCVSCGYSKCS